MLFDIKFQLGLITKRNGHDEDIIADHLPDDEDDDNENDDEGTDMDDPRPSHPSIVK